MECRPSGTVTQVKGPTPYQGSGRGSRESPARVSPTPPFPAVDLGSQRLLREARSCLDEVMTDLFDVEHALARFKAWLAVPPEFRRKDHDRVA